jgi:hypothetical protein
VFVSVGECCAKYTPYAIVERCQRVEYTFLSGTASVENLTGVPSERSKTERTLCKRNPIISQ